MILGQVEASKVLPLVTDLASYEAFQELLKILHKDAYDDMLRDGSNDSMREAIGKLKLLDELGELKLRLKDSLKHVKSDFTPINL